MSETKMPECEKLAKVAPQSQSIGNFLDWMREEKHVYLALEHLHSDSCHNEEGDRVCGTSNHELIPWGRNIESILAEYFEIDLKKVEEERQSLLGSIRSGKEMANG